MVQFRAGTRATEKVKARIEPMAMIRFRSKISVKA